MATPLSRSNSIGALGTGPSRTLLQQLLEEINGVSSTRTSRNASPSQSSASASSRSSPSNHVSSPWLKGSLLAQDAHDKLRAVDEALWQRPPTNATDGTPDLQTPRLRLDTPRLDTQDTTPRDEHRRAVADEYMQHMQHMHMLKTDPLSTNNRLSPALQGHDHNTIFPPLSPLIFSDVYFDDSSSLSPQTETTVSPTEMSTSAATACTVEEPRTLNGNDGFSLYSSPGLLLVADPNAALKRTHFFNEPLADSIAQKRRAMTVPEIRSEGYLGIAVNASHEITGVDGDNLCLLRHETFTERAPTSRISANISTSYTLPELSSFRPNAADPQGQPAMSFPSPETSRVLASRAEQVNPAVPDTPAWMRPMHLVDTGSRSIYTNVHDDGPIRHALCLWCFRTQGSFRKVHKHGYESCGRKEVLDSHYWEDNKWPEDSSDESAASDC